MRPASPRSWPPYRLPSPWWTWSASPSCVSVRSKQHSRSMLTLEAQVSSRSPEVARPTPFQPQHGQGSGGDAEGQAADGIRQPVVSDVDARPERIENEPD